jgi:LmbE family N-acetylglucosaminyl deacetylase
VSADASLAGLTVLVVLAHPDDESLTCGGTLARLADAGVRVVLLCASHGERGNGDGTVPDPALARVRATELRAAAAVLGVSHLLLLDYPDGVLRWARVSELQAQIAMTIRRFRPAAVITFGADGLYWHVDHIGVHERTTAAVGAFGADAPALYYATMPQGAMRAVIDSATARGWSAPATGFWSLPPDAFGFAASPPTLVVDVGRWANRKVAALCAHRSQMGEGHPLAGLGEADVQRLLGVEHFHRARLGGSNRLVLEQLG